MLWAPGGSAAAVPHNSWRLAEKQKDIFANERRFEQRFPGLTAELPRFVQGYERTPESALAILDFLESRFPVNAALAAIIRQLAAR